MFICSSGCIGALTSDAGALYLVQIMGIADSMAFALANKTAQAPLL